VTSGAERRTRLYAGLALAVGILVTGGCGTPQTPILATPTPTASTPPSSPLATDTSAPAPSDTVSIGTGTPAVETNSPRGGNSNEPPVLDEGSSGRSLTTADFFSTPEDWADGRFDVAGQQDLPGIGGPLAGCTERPSESSPTIELRLANNFKQISMQVGQSDDSPSSDVEVNVQLLGNEEYIDTVQVPFNQIRTFRASVANVNALKIQLWIGKKGCEYTERVDAVLMDLKVE
jgi:hypothetical protein